MKRSITSFFLFFAFFAWFNTAAADDLNPTRNAIAHWVKENAAPKISIEKAVNIVELAYANAKKHGLDPLLILAIARVESSFNEKASNRYGSRGMMQVVPYWHRDKLKGRNPLDAGVSLEVGTTVFRDCWKKRSTNVVRALGCYNGGGDKKYATKVMKHRFDISKKILLKKFEDEEEIIEVSENTSL